MLALLAVPAAALAQPSCPPDVGAALAAACPCDADSNGHTWRNHGQYVKCVVQFRNQMRQQGCLDDAGKRTIARCAARSTCGKPGFVLCCFYDFSNTCVAGSCDTTVTNAAACCSNDNTAACTADSDCITASGPKIKHSDPNCAEHGGFDIGTGSACTECPIPPPATPTPAATP
jgi:hypothetical protein